MGVSSEHIILYGWDVGYETVSDWEFEEREPYYYDENDIGDVVMVLDSRSGEYGLVGMLQFCSDDRRYGQANIPRQTISEPEQEALLKLYDTVCREMDLDPERPPEHYVLTHHS